MGKMDEEINKFETKKDVKVQPFSKRQELNNHIVCMRKSVQQARVQIINRIIHQIKRYKNRKGDEKDKEKAKRKANRLLEEIHVLKKINKDRVSLHALLNTETLEEVIGRPNATPQDRVLARLSHHQVVKINVKKYRDENPNWDKQIPVLLAMTRERRKKKNDKLNPIPEKVTSKKSISQQVENASEQKEDLNDNDISDGDDDDTAVVPDTGKLGEDSEDSEPNETDDEKEVESVEVEPSKGKKLKSSNPKSQSKEASINVDLKNNKIETKARVSPVVNKSEGTVRVKVLKDLKDLEDDNVGKCSEENGKFVDITQVPKLKRPKSAFFVGGIDQVESDHEDYEVKTKPYQRSFDNRQNNIQSKPVFKKGKLVSKPPSQRSKFPVKRKESQVYKGRNDSRFSASTESLGNKRLKASSQPENSFSSDGGAQVTSEKLHPSWEAKKKQQQISLTAFKGKKIVFNDDD